MKTALITGASGAIGGSLTEKLIENGYFVVAGYNGGKENIDALKNKLGEFSDYLFSVRADLKTSEGAEKLFYEAEKNFGHIDVFVHCAGADVYKLCEETENSEWEDIFAVNTKAAFILSKLSLKRMLERKNGKIVFVSSVWGISGASMETAYSASKSALIGFSKALAKEAGYNGVTVNCVCPGVIDTKMNARFGKEEMRELIEKTPAGRLGTPKEVAELIMYLVSEKGDFITGQSIVIDGGFTL